MTNQARHNQVVKNDDEANNRYESANSWRSCFRDRVCENGPGFFYACNLGKGTTCSGMIMTTYYISNILLRNLLSTRVDFDVKLRFRKGNNPQAHVA